MASSESYIGSVDLWPLDWAPRGWALCQGQVLNVSSNQALFALIGNVYGGTAPNTFALPNMQGKFALGAGVAGTTQYTVGQKGGAVSVQLQPANVPVVPHTHSISVQVSLKASNQPGGTNTPGGYYLAMSPGGDGYTDTPDTELAAPVVAASVQPAGGGATAPVPILPPYLVLNYMIATAGLFPSRP